MMLAALTSVVWGLSFVATKYGIIGFSAPQLTAFRFLIACLPVFVVPRPKIPWSSIMLIGLTLFAGQFLLLFFAYAQGLPPGVASVSQQMQVFLTVLLAAVFLRDIPSLRQCAGMAIAFAGLVLIGLTAGADLKLTALALALAGALSWAIGNVLVKRASGCGLFPLMVWCSLIPPLPALAISSISDERSLLAAVATAPWTSIAAAVYLGTAATIFGYATWGRLLQRYPTAVVAPFALLSPCTGIVAAALVFGEVFSPLRYVGAAFILAGLAVVVLPGRRGGETSSSAAPAAE
jgi:O-acetylserine/cysteine efflux transporter